MGQSSLFRPFSPEGKAKRQAKWRLKARTAAGGGMCLGKNNVPPPCGKSATEERRKWGGEPWNGPISASSSFIHSGHIFPLAPKGFSPLHFIPMATDRRPFYPFLPRLIINWPNGMEEAKNSQKAKMCLALFKGRLSLSILPFPLPFLIIHSMAKFPLHSRQLVPSYPRWGSQQPTNLLSLLSFIPKFQFPPQFSS